MRILRDASWRGFDDEMLAVVPSHKEIVGYDVVMATHFDSGDLESGPFIEEGWESVFGTILTTQRYFFSVVVNGEETELPGVRTEAEAVEILNSLEDVHPNKDFLISPITREEAEWLFYDSDEELLI